MVTLLTTIPFDELKEIEDIRKYALNTDYFSFNTVNSKDKAADCLKDWIMWYSLYSTKPLYVTVMSDRYWYKYRGTLSTSVRFTTWKNIPRHSNEVMEYPLVPEYKMICTETDIDSICEKIREYNYNQGIFSVKIS